MLEASDAAGRGDRQRGGLRGRRVLRAALPAQGGPHAGAVSPALRRAAAGALRRLTSSPVACGRHPPPPEAGSPAGLLRAGGSVTMRARTLPGLPVMSDLGYPRFPTIHGDTLVFVCDDDLWTVGAAGGAARRLTAGLGEPTTPALSPDGRWLAFVGRDEQHPEVYLMPAAGGPARRMTWLGPDVQVRGWTPAGHIAFVTSHGQPFFRNYRAYRARPGRRHAAAAAVGAGRPPRVRSRRRDGDRPQHRRSRALEALPRRHRRAPLGRRGGRRRVPAHDRLAGNLASPMWIGERIWFLSDHEGVGNLYSCTPDGSDLAATPSTTTTTCAARTDGRRVVYHCGADLWLLDAATGTARRRDRGRRRTARRRRARFVAAADPLGRLRRAPGRAQPRRRRARQAVHVRSVGRRGAPLGARDGVRHRLGAVAARRHTPRGGLRRAGEERVEVFEDGTAHDAAVGRGPRRRDGGRARGPRVAISNHRHELLVVDVDAGTLTRRSQRLRAYRGPRRGRPTGVARLRVLPTAPHARSSSTTSRAGRPRRHAAGLPRLLARLRSRRASTSTSCRCARSTRSTTACSSTCASRARCGRT